MVARFMMGLVAATGQVSPVIEIPVDNQAGKIQRPRTKRPDDDIPPPFRNAWNDDGKPPFPTHDQRWGVTNEIHEDTIRELWHLGYIFPRFWMWLFHLRIKVDDPAVNRIIHAFGIVGPGQTVRITREMHAEANGLIHRDLARVLKAIGCTEENSDHEEPNCALHVQKKMIIKIVKILGCEPDYTFAK